MHADLMEDGIIAGRHRIARLMRDNDLKARQKRRFKKTTDSNHGGPVAPNHLDQDFAAIAPDQKWVETLFKTIKSELIWRTSFQSRRQAGNAIAQYIDGVYNPVRRHSALGSKSPIKFEDEAKQETMALH